LLRNLESVIDLDPEIPDCARLDGGAIETRFGDRVPPPTIAWLSDNGSPYIARDTHAFAREIGLESLTTAIQSPQSNGMAEAFVKTFKRDYVERMDRCDAFTVMR